MCMSTNLPGEHRVSLDSGLCTAVNFRWSSATSPMRQHETGKTATRFVPRQIPKTIKPDSPPK